MMSILRNHQTINPILTILFVLLFAFTFCPSAQHLSQQIHPTVTLPPLPVEVHPESKLKLSILEVDKDKIDDLLIFDVVILIENLTEKTILFDPNNGFHLFVYVESEDRWKIVRNLVKYTGNTDKEEAIEILVPKGKGLNYITFYSIVPEIPSDLSRPFILRVLVRGEILQDGRPTSEIIENYIDIPLHP